MQEWQIWTPVPALVGSGPCRTRTQKVRNTLLGSHLCFFTRLLHCPTSFCSLVKRMSNVKPLRQEKVLGMLQNQETAQDKERMSPVPNSAWHIQTCALDGTDSMISALCSSSDSFTHWDLPSVWRVIRTDSCCYQWVIMKGAGAGVRDLPSPEPLLIKHTWTECMSLSKNLMCFGLFLCYTYSVPWHIPVSANC